MIHFICALKCEAVPLLDYFKLKYQCGDGLFNNYINDDSQMSLTVTGIGKINAAAATMHTINCFQARKNDVWLNVGVAGHKTLPLGSALLANRIQDAASSEKWYPQILLAATFPSCNLTTVDTPATHYGDGMFDMEAAGFYSSACRIGTAELIHCLKIISDNEQSPPELLGARQVTDLIAEKLSVIEYLIGQLQNLSVQISGADELPEHFNSVIEQWHFTRYQSIRLRFLLNRWQVLLPGHNPLDASLRCLTLGAEVLAYLEHKLDSIPLDYTTKDSQPSPADADPGILN